MSENKSEVKETRKAVDWREYMVRHVDKFGLINVLGKCYLPDVDFFGTIVRVRIDENGDAWCLHWSYKVESKVPYAPPVVVSSTPLVDFDPKLLTLDPVEETGFEKIQRSLNELYKPEEDF